MQVFKKLKRWPAVVAVVALAACSYAAVGLASEVDVAVVDATAPTGSVSIEPGQTGNITIKLSVTGRQDNPASFKVNRDWTLSGGTFTGSNPQTFNVPARAAGDPATTFETSGTVTVAAGEAAGGPHTLAVGAFDISTTSPRALEAGDSSSYQVTVTQPPPPSDTTPPTIGYTLDPVSPDGDNGWYKGNVSLTWQVADPESTVTKTGCVDQSVTADQAETTYSCSASSAGGGAGPVEVKIKRDGTAPTVERDTSGDSCSNPGDNGWCAGTQTVGFKASDATSGLPANTSPFTKDITADGENQKVNSGSVTDNAGNTSNGIDSEEFDVDATKPTVSVTGVSHGATYTVGSVPAAGCDTQDATSGVATSATDGTTGGPVGSVTATCSGAKDNAGNTNSAAVTYNVVYAWTGFFRPVDNLPTLNQAKAGSAVPVKFSLGGNQGLSIMAAGYPKSAPIACDSTASADGIEETVNAGGSSLTYDALAGQYVYVWKTDRGWTGCRQLVVQLVDGSFHRANFKFTK